MVGAGISATYAPMRAVYEAIDNRRARGEAFTNIASSYGVSGALVHQVHARQVAWSSTLLQAITGQPWHSAAYAFCGEVKLPSRTIVYGPPPVQCPVTDVWFIPTHGQKYAPGLSAAVKRAARRDLQRARERYLAKGDWGR